MYRVYLNDDICILDPQKDLFLSDPVLDLQENSAGSFSFKIHEDNPGYSLVQHPLTTYCKVLSDSEVIFHGRIIRCEKDFYKGLSVECEGDLAFLDDSIQPPRRYQNSTVADYLKNLLVIHNASVEPEKQFKLGLVTVRSDGYDTLYRYTNFESTLTCIKDDLLDSFGGHLRIRYEGGNRYLDYLETYPRAADQKIEFGSNLLDFTESTSAMDLATVVIPIGAAIEGEEFVEGLDKRVTIESVNSGSNELSIPEAVASYGRIAKVVTFNDVHVPDILMRKGREWLTSNQYETVTLSLSAVDLGDLGLHHDCFRLLDSIVCTSRPHGMNRRFPLTEMKIHLLDPSKNTYTLGSSAKRYTTQVSRAEKQVQNTLASLPSESQLLNQTSQNVQELMNVAGKNGHVVYRPNEILIMDTTDIDTAQNVWRYNVAGLAHSSNGYEGPYNLAATMDGSLMAERIAAGSITADKLDVAYKNSIQKQIEDAENAAKSDTDKKLESYWTSVEVSTQIKNSGDTILLQASETAKGFADKALKDADGNLQKSLLNYAKSSDLTITADQIKGQVSKVQETMDDRFLGVYTKAETELLFDQWKVRLEETTKEQSANYIIGTQYWDACSKPENSKLSDNGNNYTLSVPHTLSSTDREVFKFVQNDIRFLPENWYCLSIFITGPSEGLIALEIKTPKYIFKEAKSNYGSVTFSEDTLRATSRMVGHLNVIFKLGSKPLGVGQWPWDPFNFQSGSIPAGSVSTTIRGMIKASSPSGEYKFRGLQLERGKEATTYNAGTEDLTTRVAEHKVELGSIASKLESKADAQNVYKKNEINQLLNDVENSVTITAKTEVGNIFTSREMYTCLSATIAQPSKSSFTQGTKTPTADLPFMWGFERLYIDRANNVYKDDAIRIISVFGKDGKDGKDGEKGISVTRLQTYYNTGASKISPPTSGSWTTAKPEYPENAAITYYLWQYQKVFFEDGTQTDTEKSVDLSWTQTAKKWSELKVSDESIVSTVGEKVGKDEIISQINQTAETIKINANKISLEGLTTINGGFKVLTDGSFEAVAGKFGYMTLTDGTLYYPKSGAAELSELKEWHKIANRIFLNNHGNTWSSTVFVGRNGIGSRTGTFGKPGKYDGVYFQGGALCFAYDDTMDYTIEPSSEGGIRVTHYRSSTYSDIFDFGADLTISNSPMRIWGNLDVSGTKNRLVKTENYGDVRLSAYETPTPYFGDIGQGIIGESGQCVIVLDPIFSQTTSGKPCVFLQAIGSDKVDLQSVDSSFFIVSGKPGTHFFWEAKAIQKGCETLRFDSPAYHPTMDDNSPKLMNIEDDTNLFASSKEYLNEENSNGYGF